MGLVATLRHRWPFVAIPVVVLATAAVVVRAVSGTDCADDCLRPAGSGAIAVSLRVVGETGEPVSGARVAVHAPVARPVELSTDDSGEARAPVLSGPAMAVVSAEGHLSEPVPLGWSDNGKVVTVRLLDRRNRVVVHSAGDVMFGRRYSAPPEKTGEQDEPLIPDNDAAAGAEDVVAAVAPAFAAADLRTVNLETVVSDRAIESAYPGKRNILKSAKQTVAGLRALSTDVAVMANNHTRDLLDAGIADTRAALKDAGIAAVGAGADETEAAAPHQRQINGAGVAVLAYTSLEGSFVNKSLPAASVKPPANLPPEDKWQYEERSWGFPEAGIPVAPRRIREAWDRFSAAEGKLDAGRVAALWASLEKAYPQVQDLVARRGHGGAALWDDTTSARQIQQAAATNSVVMVQVHSGFELQDAASDSIREISRAAIDAGADIVVAHHPHQLQGVEWYKGKLIAYSLGNFVFDQNFFASFASAFLRTVWEGDRLLEARLFPLEIVDYKPTPVTDSAARSVLTGVWERGLLPLESYRTSSGDVRTRPYTPDSDTKPAQIVISRHTGEIVSEPRQESPQRAELAPRQVVDLPAPVGPGTLVKPGAEKGVDVGRDLYRWGRFEDETADGAVSEAVHWSIDSKREGARSESAAEGLRGLRLEAKDGDGVRSRPVSRIALPRHRAYREDRGKIVSTDPDPSYSLTARVRRSPGATAELRLDIYHFDDGRLSEDPTSEVVATLVKPLDLPDDGQWHQVVVDLPLSELDSGSAQGNMVLPYLRLDAPPAGQATWLDIDDFRVIEWRDATGMSKTYGPYTVARNTANVSLTLPYTVLDSTAR
ncbi:CapA family protein [Actinokineospora globicatena]|uniref:CapA family protein n=1 Tax=Actinokineospora globicatena TaxID=103729 RepID=UPI0020A2CE4D|nr:CapA family protein [Actinokineospora globicatena]MCP2303046.1 Poly-gamma-glutamate biosynthesis protein CapA/YwtB (capsule formation), metallophosphatase superfamily [Actinokineospora globicatena]GLW79842.1 hypothetical protein Aglo01_43230 [Actinokineospora globicatena]GLW85748.1 hypothetical protein Aglo02_33880 [Actinokineospora globicatena]